MNILFIYPPINSKVLVPCNFEPLALEVLASKLNAHNVKIVDLRFESEKNFIKIIKTFSPEIVGISVNNTIQVNQSKMILQHIKSLNPHILITVGGHHPTLVPEDFFTPFVDAIFLGWAEKSFPQYVNHLEAKTKNDSLESIIILKNGLPDYQSREFPKLKNSDISMPNRDLTIRYRNNYTNEIGRKYALVNTARGCPYRCSFCACWKAAHGQYLIRDAMDVFNELIDLPNDIQRVFFADDNTFYDTERAEKLYQLIRNSNVNKKYSGYCRSDTVVENPELFKHWKEIGLENLTIGFEAMDDHSLKIYNKKNKVESNQKAVGILNDIGVPFSSYFIIDPYFKQKDFDMTLHYVKKYNLIKPRFVVLTPLPGTQLYEKFKDKINLSYDYFDFLHWVYPTKMITKEFLEYLVKLYYSSYSFKRYLRILFKNLFIRLKHLKSKRKLLKNINIIELILLRLLAIPLHRKLYREYKKN
ncbi:MAG: radical SAM protein [bacterium]